MDADLIKRFLTVFGDFLTLCSAERWPTDSTNAAEIRNAYEAAKFVENCLVKLHKRQMVDVFLAQLPNAQGKDRNYKHCLTDPPLFILKKIIRSDANVSVLDASFTVFIECFDDRRLEDCLSKLMLEKASEEVIIESFVNSNVPHDNLMEIKCNLLLATLADDESTDIKDLLEQGDEDIANIILTCLTLRTMNYQKQLDVMKARVAHAMSDKSSSYRWLWRLLLVRNKHLLVRICCEHSDIFALVISTLLDSGKVIKENVTTEFYYVDVTFSELVNVVRCLCANMDLKDDLMSTLRSANCEKTFWETIFSKI